MNARTATTMPASPINAAHAQTHARWRLAGGGSAVPGSRKLRPAHSRMLSATPGLLPDFQPLPRATVVRTPRHASASTENREACHVNDITYLIAEPCAVSRRRLRSVTDVPIGSYARGDGSTHYPAHQHVHLPGPAGARMTGDGVLVVTR